MLGNVFILCVLILMVFAIIGVQLWQGILRNRCYLDLPLNVSTYLNSTRYIYIHLENYLYLKLILYVKKFVDKCILTTSLHGSNFYVNMVFLTSQSWKINYNNERMQKCLIWNYLFILHNNLFLNTLVHEIFAWVLFSRSAPARIYNPRELEWFAQLKVRENKIARFLKDIFWFFFFLSQSTNIWDVLVWQNQTFFAVERKLDFARKWKN